MMCKNLLFSLLFAAAALVYGGTAHASEGFPLIEAADAAAFVNRVNDVLHEEVSPASLTPPTYNKSKSNAMTPLYTSHTPSGVAVDLYMTPDRAFVHRVSTFINVIDEQRLNDSLAVIAATCIAGGMTNDEMYEMFMWKPAEEVYSPAEMSSPRQHEGTFKVSRVYCKKRQQLMESCYFGFGASASMSIYAIHR